MTWSVVVEQLGEVAGGQDEKAVKGVFEDYKEMARRNIGRVAGRTVVLLVNGRVHDTFRPPKEGQSDVVKCPKCGNTTLADITYVEDASIWRRLDRVDEGGTLLIDGLYKVDDEETTNPHLSCGKCNTSYPVPEKHDFV